MKIERAKREDHAELIGLMNRSFRAGRTSHPDFRKLLPDLYQPTDESVARHRVVREKGKMLASLGLYPIDLKIGPVNLRVGGVGAVCTDPRHRGKGYMSALLEQVWEDMIDEGYALSWLSGDRNRYAHFGWETAGSSLWVDLTIRDAPPKQGPAWKLTQFSTQHGKLGRLRRVRKALTTRGWADELTLRLKLQRLHTALWEAKAPGRHYAYVVINPEDRILAEWGGEPAGVEALLRRHIKGRKPWHARVPPLHDEYQSMLFRFSQNVGHYLTNLAILDLAGVLRSYEPYMARRWPSRRAVELVMTGPRGERVLVRGGKVSTRGMRTDVKIEVDRLAMVRLLFGPVRPSCLLGRPEETAWLDQVFPLPFYMPYLWQV